MPRGTCITSTRLRSRESRTGRPQNSCTPDAPLRELRQLQKLRISVLNRIKVSLEPLRQHPSLQYIALGGAGPYRPVAEFWADYDAQQAAGKK